MDMTDRIMALVDERNISVTAFEKSLNIGVGTIKRYRTSSPRVESILKIAQALGTTAGYIIDGYDESNNSNMSLDDREKNLIEHYRALDLDGKAHVEHVAVEEHRRMKLEGDSPSSAS